MCIRDRHRLFDGLDCDAYGDKGFDGHFASTQAGDVVLTRLCLLYTSDAADERSSVDLGGRRIIKKKNNQHHVQDVVIL